MCQSQLLLEEFYFFFFNDTATTEIYTLSLHDALPISHAIPPCAQWVEPAETSSLVTTMIVPRSRHSNAAVKPAMPDPMTTMSTSRIQPGGSAASRCGNGGNGGSAG